MYLSFKEPGHPEPEQWEKKHVDLPTYRPTTHPTTYPLTYLPSHIYLCLSIYLSIYA